ncbi:MAG: HAD-IA family hydrolase [Bacilli bacterium]|nr:HAD-IA family hydrolase [Bacilli bacterium]
MIKVVAFDLVGVLVSEKDVNLTKEQERLERLFDAYDEPVDEEARLLRIDDIKKATLDIFNKLYEIKNPDLFRYLKDNYNVRIVIASNHVSYIKDYLIDNFNPDDIYLSSLIGLAKPNKDYFKYILDKENIKPNELLFLDDREKNIANSSELGINTIFVNSKTNILEEIKKFMI